MSARHRPARDNRRAQRRAAARTHPTSAVLETGAAESAPRVPADAAWTTDPHRLIVHDDRAVGLGAADIKGAAACLVVAPGIVVVVEADEPDERGSGAGRLDDVCDEPLTVARVDDLALGRETVRSGRGGSDGGRGGIQARRRENEGLEIGARAGGLIEVVAPAHCAQLVAAELAQHGGEAIAQVKGELCSQGVFAGGGRAHFAAKKAAKIEEPADGERAEHRGERRRRDRANGGGNRRRRSRLVLPLVSSAFPALPWCLSRSSERERAPQSGHAIRRGAVRADESMRVGNYRRRRSSVGWLRYFA